MAGNYLQFPQPGHPEHTEETPTGVFEIMEGDKSHGHICFNEDTWEYDDTGDLSYVEVEAIAEAIQFNHK